MTRNWFITGSFHPRWRAKDGDRWHIQLWRPNGGFIVSHRGWRIKVIR